MLRSHGRYALAAAETRMAVSPTLLNQIGALRGTTHPFGLMSLIPPNECG
jgi:hypothetical protein